MTIPVRVRERLRRHGAWALVTGASSGIGQACARDLASAGVNLVVVARSETALLELSEELIAKHGVEIRVVPIDLATSSGVETTVEAARGLDLGLLVASAGFGTSGDFLHGQLHEELGMIDVNCRAVVELCHRVIPGMVSRGRGGVVLFSSLVAFQGTPRAANYAATKAFVQTFAEGLGAELRGTGVEVLATAPGPTLTGFGRRADMDMRSGLSPEVVARQTLAALGRRRTVRPGFLSKFLEASLRVLPRWGRTRMLGIVMGGMTRHQSARGKALPAAR